MTNSSVRALWLATALLLSLIAGLSGGTLSALAGDSVARAVMTGGATFVGTGTFLLLVLTFVGIGRR